MIMISASLLYDLVQCPHRVTMDLFTDPARRDPVNAFVELLWEKGHAFEEQVMEDLKIPFVNLRPLPVHEKERLTTEAMKRGDDLIYSGRIRADDLVGEPDLLRRQGTGYVAGDIKSGAGTEGMTEEGDGKPKRHYAVQLALYTDILERLNLSAGRRPFIWDIHGNEVVYDLDAMQGVRDPKSLWTVYHSVLETVRKLITREDCTLPALSRICRLCHWYSACTRRLEEMDDLTLIPELGRTSRDAMRPLIKSVNDLALIDPEAFIEGKKTTIQGVGPESLKKFNRRARLQKEPGSHPYIKEDLRLPHSDPELFFDIETDPMRDFCYLHGFVERRGGDSKTERYIAFYADTPTPDEEERIFAEALAYLGSEESAIVYYYSPYERTIWRRLQKRFPNVATAEEIEAIFDPRRAVDLYQHVVRKTEWPTRDYSIKSLASYLGFKWRDTNPSGTASIEWYHRWVQTGDAEIRRRILEYNEDDCVAMRVLLDAIRKMGSHLKY